MFSYLWIVVSLVVGQSSSAEISLPKPAQGQWGWSVVLYTTPDENTGLVGGNIAMGLNHFLSCDHDDAREGEVEIFCGVDETQLQTLLLDGDTAGGSYTVGVSPLFKTFLPAVQK